MGRRRGGNQTIPRPTTWSAGGLPPWAEPSPPVRAADVVDALRSAAQDSLPGHPDGPDAHPDRPADTRASAVVVLLADGDDGAEVLLTRRSVHLSSHRGEISFPGGRLDAGEDYVTAALREADEEVGLRQDAADVVGALDPIHTWVSRSWIVPVVAVAEASPDALDLAPRTSEVDRVLWVPVHDLTRPGTYREERWHLDRGEVGIHFFELDDETVWGATARVLRQLLAVVHGPPAARTAT